MPARGADDIELKLKFSELLLLDRRILNAFVQNCHYGSDNADCEAIIKKDDIKFHRSSVTINSQFTIEPTSATLPP